MTRYSTAGCGLQTVSAVLFVLTATPRPFGTGAKIVFPQRSQTYSVWVYLYAQFNTKNCSYHRINV